MRKKKFSEQLKALSSTLSSSKASEQLLRKEQSKPVKLQEFGVGGIPHGFNTGEAHRPDIFLRAKKNFNFQRNEIDLGSLILGKL